MPVSKLQIVYSAVLLALGPAGLAQGLPAEAGQAITETPVQSTRAESMGGAIPTLADDRDALFENPAGIGGVRNGKKESPWVKKLYFPWGSASVNKSSRALYKDLRSQGGINDSTVGKAVVDAYGGAGQYARANAGVGLVFGRTMVLPFVDSQLAATAMGDGTNLIKLHERATTGVAYGFSATDPNETFGVGYSGFIASRSEVQGNYLYDDFINQTARAKVLKDDTTTSTGVGQNIGVNWRMGKTASPTLGVVLKNAGGTHFRVTKGPAKGETVPQDLTTAFSVSPQVGKSGELNASIAADRLLDSEVSFVKKYHAGAELLLGGTGSYARFGLRGGVNAAGPSAGVSLNVGLLGLDAGVNSVDIGLGNQKVIEHRFVGTLYVNVADF